MRIELHFRYFTVRSAVGGYNRCSYTVLLPLLVTLVLFLCALTSKRIILQDLDSVENAAHALAVLISDVADESRTSLAHLIYSSPTISRTSSLETLRLYVDGNVLGDMQDALATGNRALGHKLGGDKPYFPAALVDEKRHVRRVAVCLRGDNEWHHRPEKPSLRIKLRKRDVGNSVRYYELQRPKNVLAVKNLLPQQLAKKFGLLSDHSQHVRLFVNEKFFGVYIQTIRPGCSFALKNGRMPGTFFKDNDPIALWESIHAWTAHGEAIPEDIELFAAFLECLRRKPNAENFAVLAELIDLDKYAKWSALMAVCGGLHSNAHQNHVFFFDSTHGLLEAVPWDVHGYNMMAVPTTPVDCVLHPLMDHAVCSPHWVHLRNLYIQELLDGIASEDSHLRQIDETVERILPDLHADPSLMEVQGRLSGWRGVGYSVLDIDDKQAELKRWVRQRCKFLRWYLSDVHVHVSRGPTRADGSTVRVSGAVAVRVMKRKANGEILADFERVLHPGRTRKLTSFISQPNGHEASYLVPFAEFASLEYELPGEPDEFEFYNAVTGEQIFATDKQVDDIDDVRTIHPSRFAPKETGDVVLGPGNVELDRDLHVVETQRLIICAGTTIHIGEGVGIYSRGKVTVNGTAEKPVEIIPAGEKPWAAFGVSGPGADGSTFRYMKVHGGSLGRDGGVRFKGMFDLYHCGEVSLDHCEFGRNFNSDDAVNIVKSNATVRDCIWRNANADALDMDMCSGVVQGCKFLASGNDGLDLMTCQIRVDDCEFFDSGDKGISIGENTKVFIERCNIAGCDMGIEVKDASRALLRNCLFRENRVAVHCYQKKWLYGRGGNLALVDCVVRNTLGSDFWIEKRSDVLLMGTEFGTVCEGRERIETVNELPETWVEFKEDMSATTGQRVTGNRGILKTKPQ